MSTKKEKNKINYVVDATNVTGWHNINIKDRQADNTLDTVLLLANLLYDKKQSFLFIFDANTIYKLEKEDQVIYNKLLKNFEHEFYQVTGGQRADDYVLAVANKFNSKVISTDRYRDYNKTYKWLNSEDDRLIKGGVMSILDELNLVIPSLKITENLNETCKELYNKLAQKMGKIIPPENDMGKIKSYNHNNQWGFILNESGDEVYFKGGDFDIIGLPVKFVKHTEPDRVFAKNVEVSLGKSKSTKTAEIIDAIEGEIEWFDSGKNLGLVKTIKGDKKYTFKKDAFEHKEMSIEPGLKVNFIPYEKSGKSYAYQLRLSNLAEKFLVKKEVDKMLTKIEDMAILVNNSRKKYNGIVQEITAKQIIIKVDELAGVVFHNKNESDAKVNVGDKVGFTIGCVYNKLMAKQLGVLEAAPVKVEKNKAETNKVEDKSLQKNVTDKKVNKGPKPKANSERNLKSGNVGRKPTKPIKKANSNKPKASEKAPTKKQEKQVKDENVLEILPGENIKAQNKPDKKEPVEEQKKNVQRKKVVRKPRAKKR